MHMHSLCLCLSVCLCLSLHTHTHTHTHIQHERERGGGGARRKTFYWINSTCSFQGRNWTHAKCIFILHKTITDCNIKSWLSTVVHFSRLFHALNSCLHTCIILCILLLLYLLSDKIVYPNLPCTFALNQPFLHPLSPLPLFLSDTNWIPFIHLMQLESACGRFCTESVKAE